MAAADKTGPREQSRGPASWCLTYAALPRRASRARSSSEANGPTAKLANADSTPACGCVGAMRSATCTADASLRELVGVELLGEQRELLGLLARRMLQHGGLQVDQFLAEVSRPAGNLLEFSQRDLGIVLLGQAGVGDLGAAVDLPPHTGVHHHLLRRLVHGQQRPQPREGFLLGGGVLGVERFDEQRLDGFVLIGQVGDDVLRRRDRAFGPRQVPPFLKGIARFVMGIAARGLRAGLPVATRDGRAETNEVRRPP